MIILYYEWAEVKAVFNANNNVFNVKEQLVLTNSKKFSFQIGSQLGLSSAACCNIHNNKISNFPFSHSTPLNK